MVPPEAVRVTASPPQMVALFETVTVGEGITATETESVSVHAPMPAITIYVEFTRGETVIADVIAPLLQE